MEVHDLGQAEEVRAGRLPLRVAIIRVPETSTAGSGEEDREAGQRGRYGEDSSTHGVTSRGVSRGMADGIARVLPHEGWRRERAADDTPYGYRCDPRARVAPRGGISRRASDPALCVTCCKRPGPFLGLDPIRGIRYKPASTLPRHLLSRLRELKLAIPETCVCPGLRAAAARLVRPDGQ